MGWYERMVSMDGRLQGKARNDRQLMLLGGCVSSGTATLLLLVTRPWPLRVVQCAFLMLGGLSVILPLLCGRAITRRHACTSIAVCGIGLMVSDHESYTISSSPVWPIFVLLADLSLVLRLGRAFATRLIAAVALWVILVRVESVLRFGLFDLPGSAPQAYRWERFRSECSCDTPPCAVDGAKSLFDFTNSLTVLVVDFMATRGFADAAEKEQAAMARTIETVEAIAQLLAGYDVDTVADMLQEAEAEGQLPAAMHEALQRLEQNLRAYRPYLPEALFEQLHHDENAKVARCMPGSAPGLSGEAALVFTDVRASTPIWEAAPEAMQTHNTVIREIIKKLGGYEVKTIGDAFMVAFEQACTAVDFGLAVQQELLDAQWPAALLEVPICRRTDLWGGLTVRIGVNHGPVTLETNALTGRVDYFGHTVNVAARLEAVCIPGAVAVPADLWAQVSAACLPAAPSAEVPTYLKGVSGGVTVRNVWPAALAARQDHPLAAPALHESQGLGSTSRSASQRRLLEKSARMHEQEGTVGTASIRLPAGGSFATGIMEYLEAVMPLLQQSRGTLITLLGEHVFVGWNLVHAVPVHAENAVRFAQRVLRSPSGADVTMGLASGTVHHGDVGTSTQRFVTAAGRTVDASLQVWRAARDAGVRCLYTTADADRPLGALHCMLQLLAVPGAPQQAYELSWNECPQMRVKEAFYAD